MYRYLTETKILGIPLILHIIVPPFVAYGIFKLFT